MNSLDGAICCPGQSCLRPPVTAHQCMQPLALSCATHWLAANNFLRLVTKLGATLLKWQLMSLTEFDWVLFTDMDVDVMPLSLSPHGNAAIAGDWDRTLREAQRAESIRLVVNADWSSPVNTGVMLLRPSWTSTSTASRCSTLPSTRARLEHERSAAAG